MAFVVTSGQLQSIHRAPIQAFATSRMLTDTLHRHYTQIWRAQPQVRTVVGFLARNIAQIGLHTYRRISNTDRQRLIRCPLARPTPDLTNYRMIQRLVSDLVVYDVAFLAKVRAADGALGALVQIPTNRATVLGKFMAVGRRVLDSRQPRAPGRAGIVDRRVSGS